MSPPGSKSQHWLIATCVLSARWALVCAFAAVLVFSSPLSITSRLSLAANSSHKVRTFSPTKAKVLSAASEEFSSSCRAAHRRVNRRLSLFSVSSPSHDAPQPIFRPLRC
jgi:hypothetical protein